MRRGAALVLFALISMPIYAANHAEVTATASADSDVLSWDGTRAALIDAAKDLEVVQKTYEFNQQILKSFTETQLKLIEGLKDDFKRHAEMQLFPTVPDKEAEAAWEKKLRTLQAKQASLFEKILTDNGFTLKKQINVGEFFTATVEKNGQHYVLKIKTDGISLKPVTRTGDVNSPIKAELNLKNVMPSGKKYPTGKSIEEQEIADPFQFEFEVKSASEFKSFSDLIDQRNHFAIDNDFKDSKDVQKGLVGEAEEYLSKTLMPTATVFEELSAKDHERLLLLKK